MPFNDEQQMLSLSLASYQGFWMPHLDEPGDARAHDVIAAALSSLEPLRGRWALAWGPASRRPTLSVFDDALMFVARDLSHPSRYAVVIRGTNPVSIPDWIFGDLWAARDIAWRYGGDPDGARLSLSTSLGLSTLQSLRSTRFEQDRGLFLAVLKAGVNALLEPIARAVGEELTRMRNAVRQLASGLLPADVVSAAERFEARLAARASGSYRAMMAHIDEAMRVAETKITFDFYRFLEEGQRLRAESSKGIDVATFLRRVTDRGVPVEVHVTGHSKGAALATAVALWLRDTQGLVDQWDPSGMATVRCTTFAGPTPGNGAFARRVGRKLGGRLRRVANDRDLITTGWSRAGLATVGSIFAPRIETPRKLTELARVVSDEVAPLDYQHVDEHAVRFSGAVAVSEPEFLAQAVRQHLEGYLEHYGLSASIDRERIFGLHGPARSTPRRATKGDAMTEAGASSAFRALLIGVDFYFPNQLPGGASYPSLRGCVADITRVEGFLRARVTPAPEIRKLVAAHDPRDLTRPAGDPASWPTSAAITAAFERLVADSEAGDRVYIHYSGHGGRVRTKYPDLKGDGQMDETLVPTDIGHDGATGPGVDAGRYVRDVYIARYLHALAQKGALVTLVFDSCHSGGATRAAEAGVAVRTATGGETSVDASAAPADAEELAREVRAAWRALDADAADLRRRNTGARNAVSGGSWVPDAGRYVFLAACLETESALETNLEDGTRGGVLTDALLRALGSPEGRQTWKTVYERVSASVRSRYPQTPQLFGELDREALGVDLLAVARTVTVKSIDAKGRRVSLATGLATGVTRGARFEVYKLGTTDFSKPELAVATAVVSEVGAVESWAKLDADADVARIKDGAPAVQLSAPLCHTVSFVQRARPAAAAVRKQNAAFASVKAMIRKDGAGFIAVSRGGASPRFLVGLDDEGRYEVLDGRIVDGKRQPVANLPPPIGVDEKDAAKRLVARLVRLARYHTLLALEQSLSTLNDTVKVELLEAPTGYVNGAAAEGGEALPLIDGGHVVGDGAQLFLRVTNGGARGVKVAALDFTCRWGIGMVVPRPDEAPFEVVGPGERRSFPIKMIVPDGFAEVPDVIKVFVTLGAADFQLLRMPNMGDASTRGAARSGRRPSSSLDRVFMRLDAAKNTRDAEATSAPGAEWMTKHFSVLVTKKPVPKASRPEVEGNEAPPPSPFTHASAPSAEVPYAAQHGRIRGTATFRDVKARFEVGGIHVELEAREVVANFETPPEAEAAPRFVTESHALTPQEIVARLDAQADGGEAVLAAMFPPGTDTANMLADARGEAPRGLWPFTGTPVVNETELASFNASFRSVLAAPVSVEEARSMKFQTDEDWKGYVTTGAFSFVSGAPVTRPLKEVLHSPSSDMTVSLRPGQDPAQNPLRMGLFADFGNGLHASREVARRIIERRFPYAFHLGDVYYDGNAEEFRRYFAEPLEPMLRATELFMLAGNHEMYSRGEHFQKYIMEKSGRYPGAQRQRAELFRIRGDGLQIIGLDTMWCGWQGKPGRGNEPRLDAPTRALLDSWLSDGDPDGMNILMTGNEPWSTDSRKTTGMLADLEPFIRRGLIDLWFWGNVHQAAIYDGWRFSGMSEHGFIGACVGHGGYPFYTQGAPTPPSGVTCRWSERRHRFWPFHGVRPDVGLNGWCELAVSRNVQGWEVSTVFRDWVGRDRARSVVHKPRGMGPRLVSVEENQAPELGRSDWKAR